ncbi:MAG: hypothetical protein ACFCU3_00995 [Verrucomicrobiales bacterium]
MLVVCDTSPISALLTVGKAGLVAELFGGVVVPPAVAEELLRFHPSIPPWLRIVPVSDTKK